MNREEAKATIQAVAATLPIPDQRAALENALRGLAGAELPSDPEARFAEALAEAEASDPRNASSLTLWVRAAVYQQEARRSVPTLMAGTIGAPRIDAPPLEERDGPQDGYVFSLGREVVEGDTVIYAGQPCRVLERSPSPHGDGVFHLRLGDEAGQPAGTWDVPGDYRYVERRVVGVPDPEGLEQPDDEAGDDGHGAEGGEEASLDG